MLGAIFVAVAGGDEQAVSQVQDSRQHRQQAWIRKKRGLEVDAKHWQPRKRHRKDAYVWLCETDWQLPSITHPQFGPQ